MHVIVQDRLQITALRNCMFLALFTDADNKEIRRAFVDLETGQSRGDIQFVLGLDGTMSDLPEEYEHLAEDEMISVAHPTAVGETCDSFGVIRLKRLP